MSESEYLDFQLEGLDDGSPLIVQYGSKWASWLLGVAKQLTNPEIWHPDGQVDLAVQYANELVTRLMGMAELSPQVMAQNPITVFGISIIPYPGQSVALMTSPTSALFQGKTVSVPTNEVVNWAYFEVFLPVGDYTAYFHMSTMTNRGKVRVLCPTMTGLSDSIIDLYSSPGVGYAFFTETFSITVSGVHRVTLEKNLKRAAATQCYLNFAGCVIQQE